VWPNTKDLNQKLVSCTPPPAIDPVLSFRLLGACKLPHTQALEISEIFSSAPSTPVSHRDFRTCNTEALKIYFLQSVQHRSQSLGINTETKNLLSRKNSRARPIRTTHVVLSSLRATELSQKDLTTSHVPRHLQSQKQSLNNIVS
jgi:hypothetical protein